MAKWHLSVGADPREALRGPDFASDGESQCQPAAVGADPREVIRGANFASGDGSQCQPTVGTDPGETAHSSEAIKLAYTIHLLPFDSFDLHD